MISLEELEHLLNTIDSLEAQVASQAARLDFLERERTLRVEGAGELLKQFGGASFNGEPTPIGHVRGNAGQLCIADHEMVYRMLREQRGL
ncbi:hypothetical protein D8770_26810 [Methylobacterium sp. DB1607]|nr:hypothetical protein [Methylobacterium sp. DB1607]